MTAGGGTGVPLQTPAVQTSPAVHGFPSLHAVPLSGVQVFGCPPTQAGTALAQVPTPQRAQMEASLGKGGK